MATPPPISAAPPPPISADQPPPTPGPSAAPTPASLGVLRCGGAERERRLADLPVWALLLSVASSVWRWESAVKKRKTRRRPAAPPSSLWRAIRLPTPPALKMCVECGATETPQWRAGPEGGQTLCNACGVRHRAAGRFYGKLRGSRVRRPKARQDSDYHQPPPEIPAAASPPESQIWEGPILKGFFRAVRKRQSPATAVNQPQKKKTKKKHFTGEKEKQQQKKQCEHCGASSTSKWRRGEMGMTLCNACGLRYNEGRLLPEYRPQECPTFNKRMHASSHTEVLRLNRERHLQLVQDSQDAYLMEDYMLLDLPAPPPPSPAEAEYYLAAGDDLRAAAIDGDGGDASANNNVNAGGAASGSGTNDYPMMHLPAPPPSTAEVARDYLRAAATAIVDDYSSANNVVNAGASGSGTNVNDYRTTTWMDPFLLEGPAAPMFFIDDDDN